LELGCGDGANLVPMAYSMQGSEFIGIDLSERALDRARAFAVAVGVDNVSLLQRDIRELPSDVGRFDYVIAHGVYSWVPPAVRSSLLENCSKHLNDEGIAFISYNTHPGGHIRALVRDMMRFDAHGMDSPAEKVARARQLVSTLGRVAEGPGYYRALLAEESIRIADYSEHGLFHDDLADVNDPVYFVDFVRAAEEVGLQYLSEAHWADVTLRPSWRAALLQLTNSEEPLIREQYLDFVRCRRFRQTLLCPASAKTASGISLANLSNVWFSTQATEDRTGGWCEFTTPSGASARVEEGVHADLLRYLAEAAPEAVAAPQILNRFCEPARNASPAQGELAEFLVTAMLTGVLEAYAWSPPVSRAIPDMPRASAVAREQAKSGGEVTNLLHRRIQIAPEAARMLLPLLDGRHDLMQLRGRLAELATHLSDHEVDSQLDAFLHAYAKSGLLAREQA
jgi:SAM-dependent methyltransferase